MTRARRLTAVFVSGAVAIGSLHGCARRLTGRDDTAAGRAAHGGEVVPTDGRVARVALAVGVADVRVGARGSWRLLDESGRDVAAQALTGDAWRVERRGAEQRLVGASFTSPWQRGPIVIRAQPDAFVVYNGRRWRGEIWTHAVASGVTVVNRVAVEPYLRGVVPLELGTSAPNDVAALEAQSVAARSYVYSRLPEFEPRDVAIRQAALPYDLRATTNDQAYGGVDVENVVTDRAIAATAGLVLRYNGAVVTAPYHSSCGGSTAEATELWASEPEPWLSRVSDRVPGTNRYYCDIAPRFRWTRSWDAATLRGVLAQYLRASAITRNAGAALRGVSVAGHTESGRAAALTITTDAATTTVRGNDIRFAMRSVGGDILPSTYFSVDTERDEEGRISRVTLRGNGNGHGVGMCQWGAVGRARAGQDFRTILSAYFPRASIEGVE